MKNLYFLFLFTGWQDIIDTQHKNQGQLYIKIIYKPYVDNFSPNVELACPDTYFPLRKSNRVTLYSCARSLPTKDAAGKSFQSPSLWLDLYSSLVASRKFIYITGWSVNTNIKLLRYVCDWVWFKVVLEMITYFLYWTFEEISLFSVFYMSSRTYFLFNHAHKYIGESIIIK